MSWVKAFSFNDNSKGEFLCLCWPPDVLQQAMEIQKRSLGDLTVHQTDCWGRWDLIRFPFWGHYYKTEAQFLFHRSPISNLLQVFSVCAANAFVHQFVQQKQVQIGCTANSMSIPANSTISTLTSRKAFLSDAIMFDLADFWLWSMEKYATKQLDKSQVAQNLPHYSEVYTHTINF